MNLLRCIWWSDGGSNPRPPACKAGALPTELPPRHDLKHALTLRHKAERNTNLCRALPAPQAKSHLFSWMVGVPGLEPGTSILSGWRSNQLSYTPDLQGTPYPLTCVPCLAVASRHRVLRSCVWKTQPPPPGLPSGVCGCWRLRESLVLPRKEVIQPHLPVRLPCYDFVPVARPTLGRCVHCWSTHGLQVFPTPMT